MKKTFIIVVISVLAIMAVAFTAQPPVSDQPTVTIVQEIPDTVTVESVYKGVNDERAKHELEPLTPNQLLEKSACLKADDMLENQYWAHVSPSGVTPWKWFGDVGYVFKFAGENLAKDFSSTSVLFNKWTNSPTHEENIIGTFKDMGVCIRYGKFLGYDMNIIVNHFGLQ